MEAAFHDPDRRPDQYFDPISPGGLILSIAGLDWTIYTDLKTRTAKPAPEVVARTIRVRLAEGPEPTDPAQRDRIIELTVEELTRETGST